MDKEVLGYVLSALRTLVTALHQLDHTPLTVDMSTRIHHTGVPEVIIADTAH